MKIDPITMKARFGAAETSKSLTASEYRLAMVLNEKLPNAVSIGQLEKLFSLTPKGLRVKMCLLRKKLSEIGVNVVVQNGRATLVSIPKKLREVSKNEQQQNRTAQTSCSN